MSATKKIDANDGRVEERAYHNNSLSTQRHVLRILDEDGQFSESQRSVMTYYSIRKSLLLDESKGELWLKIGSQSPSIETAESQTARSQSKLPGNFFQTQYDTDEGDIEETQTQQSLLGFLNQPCSQTDSEIPNQGDTISIVPGFELWGGDDLFRDSAFLCFERLCIPPSFNINIDGTMKYFWTIKDMRSPSKLKAKDNFKSGKESTNDTKFDVEIMSDEESNGKSFRLGWKPLPRRHLTPLSHGDKIRIRKHNSCPADATQVELIESAEDSSIVIEFAMVKDEMEARLFDCESVSTFQKPKPRKPKTESRTMGPKQTEEEPASSINQATETQDKLQDPPNTFIGTMRRRSQTETTAKASTSQSFDLESGSTSIAVDSTVNHSQTQLRASRMDLLSRPPNEDNTQTISSIQSRKTEESVTKTTLSVKQPPPLPLPPLPFDVVATNSNNDVGTSDDLYRLTQDDIDEKSRASLPIDDESILKRNVSEHPDSSNERVTSLDGTGSAKENKSYCAVFATKNDTLGRNLPEDSLRHHDEAIEASNDCDASSDATIPECYTQQQVILPESSQRNNTEDNSSVESNLSSKSKKANHHENDGESCSEERDAIHNESKTANIAMETNTAKETTSQPMIEKGGEENLVQDAMKNLDESIAAPKPVDGSNRKDEMDSTPETRKEDNAAPLCPPKTGEMPESHTGKRPIIETEDRSVKKRRTQGTISGGNSISVSGEEVAGERSTVLKSDADKKEEKADQEATIVTKSVPPMTRRRSQGVRNVMPLHEHETSDVFSTTTTPPNAVLSRNLVFKKADEMYRKRFKDAIAKKSISIVFSGVESDDASRIASIGSMKLHDDIRVKISDSVDACTTICIMPLNRENHEEAVARTLKSLECSLLGIPIVPQEWIDECLKSGRIWMPNKFIRSLPVTTETNKANDLARYGVARLAAIRCDEPDDPPLPFKNVSVFFCGVYSAEKRKGLARLLKASGAKVFTKLRAACTEFENILKGHSPLEKFVLLFGDPGKAIPISIAKMVIDALKIQKCRNLYAVDCNWVSLSIATATFLPPETFKPVGGSEIWELRNELGH